jgi:hypothetical protein
MIHQIFHTLKSKGIKKYEKCEEIQRKTNKHERTVRFKTRINTRKAA